MTDCRATEAVKANKELGLRSRGPEVATLPGGKTNEQSFERPGRGRARGRP